MKYAMKKDNNGQKIVIDWIELRSLKWWWWRILDDLYILNLHLNGKEEQEDLE